MPENNQILSVEGQLVGMPLAGPETFSQQQLEYLKRALGVDETVLFTYTDTTQSNVADGATFATSESPFNFKEIKIYARAYYEHCEALWMTISTATYVNGFTFVTFYKGGGSNQIRIPHTSFTMDSAGLHVLSGQSGMTTVEPTNKVTGGTCRISISKIVGVGRIAGGN